MTSFYQMGSIGTLRANRAGKSKHLYEQMGRMDAWHAHTATIDAAQHGDAQALESLIATAWPHAFRIAFSMLRHPMSAEDAAQDACARVVHALPGLRSSAAFGLWFYRLVVREVLIHERRRRVHEPLDPLALPSDSGLTDALVRLDVLDALGTLPPKQRAVIALHYYADLSSREIAGVLGIPDGTVRYLLSLARKQLETALAAHRPLAAQGVPLRVR
jgi:RNA polymerase sigma factor (sigma-70 family)